MSSHETHPILRPGGPLMTSRSAALALAIDHARTLALTTHSPQIVCQQGNGSFVSLFPGQSNRPVAKISPDGEVEPVLTRWDQLRKEIADLRTEQKTLAHRYSQIAPPYDPFLDERPIFAEPKETKQLAARSDEIAQSILKKKAFLYENEPADSYLSALLEEMQAEDAGTLTLDWLFHHLYPRLNLKDYDQALHTYTPRDLAKQNHPSNRR